jgi:hypothetical protein
LQSIQQDWHCGIQLKPFALTVSGDALCPTAIGLDISTPFVDVLGLVSATGQSGRGSYFEVE